MTTPPQDLAPIASEFLVYTGDDGAAHVQVRLSEGSVWLTQRLMAELFGKDVRTINEHLQGIYEEGELEPEATIRKFRIVQSEGNRSVSRLVDHYSLPAILAVGSGSGSEAWWPICATAPARMSYKAARGLSHGS